MGRRTDPRIEQRDHHQFTGSTRVDEAWYSSGDKKLEVRFVDRTRWVYTGVGPQTWRRFKATGSPGRYVADVLDRHPNRHA